MRVYVLTEHAHNKDRVVKLTEWKKNEVVNACEKMMHM